MDQTLPSILVIDDEPATLTMFRLFLSAYGHEVFVASDGKSGLALVKKHRPGIVFTDLKMPEMDGFEVLRQVKQIAPRTEVVVITGHGDMDLVVRALNLDATDFINKPIRRTALETTLKRAGERLQRPLPESSDISYALDRGIGRIRIEGILCLENRDQLLDCCRQAREKTDSPVLIQFQSSATVNGPGIAELIGCLSTIRENRQQVAVLGPSENFRVIFEMVGVSRFASLYDREEDALAALKEDIA